MPAPTLSIQVDELKKQANELEKRDAIIEEKLNRDDQRISAIEAAQAKTSDIVETLRREHEREIALLKQQNADLRQSWDKWTTRIWPIVVAIAAMVVGYVLGIKK